MPVLYLLTDRNTEVLGNYSRELLALTVLELMLACPFFAGLTAAS